MLRIVAGDIHLIDLKTRLPFKYGIATMTSAPHAFVRVRVEIDGREFSGISADHLPPKWFTKVPDKPLDVEIDEMLSSIEHAVATAVGLKGATAFDVWRELYDIQHAWGVERTFPALLSNFGTTLVERAVIEAACKAAGQPFARMVATNALGVRLEEIDPRLRNGGPADFLPPQPCGRIIARHTIGMADPLTDADIAENDRLDDGLPQSLAACIAAYGLKHVKVKVSGDVRHDIDRLESVRCAVGSGQTGTTAHCSLPTARFTMDGNEQFRSLVAFRDYWGAISGERSLQPFLRHLLFVEQPFHRDVALDENILGGLKQWADRPRLIIDESDAELDSLARAVEIGYHGTSHKNCKGVFRGIASACRLALLRRERPETPWVMSGEDLANIGPVALLQDLAVVAALGVESVERNGHHYFAGLSAFPDSVRQQVVQSHPDLYHASRAGWPTLDIRDGELSLDTINAAPFGVGFDLDVEQFLPVDQWRTKTVLPQASGGR